MRCAKSEKRTAASNVVEVVVGICYMQLASILSGVLVRTTDQRALGLWQELACSCIGMRNTYVVMKEGVRDGHPISSVRQIN